MNLKLIVYGQLKDYFPQSFDIEASENTSVAELTQQLVEQTPEASEVLQSCRWAINDELQTANYIISQKDLVEILPPSSGG